MTSNRCTIVSADGHVGADRLDYRDSLDRRWHEEFDARNRAYVNPFTDLVEPSGCTPAYGCGLHPVQLRHHRGTDREAGIERGRYGDGRGPAGRRGGGHHAGGRPLPVTGRPLTDTPVISTRGTREYPEPCRSVQEELALDELRLICLGSGNPYVRRAQAATGWLAQLAPTSSCTRPSSTPRRSSARTTSPCRWQRASPTPNTTPDRLGKLFDIAQPRLGLAYHYHLDEDTVDPFFDGIQTTYGGPTALAQDLMVVNVTPDQITLRQAVTDLLHETPPNPKKDDAFELDPMPDGRTPDWVTDTIIS